MGKKKDNISGDGRIRWYLVRKKEKGVSGEVEGKGDFLRRGNEKVAI